MCVRAAKDSRSRGRHDDMTMLELILVLVLSHVLKVQSCLGKAGLTWWSTVKVSVRSNLDLLWHPARAGAILST